MSALQIIGWFVSIVTQIALSDHIGQYSSITYTLNPNNPAGNVFMVFDAGNSVEAIYCKDSTCTNRTTQAIKCNAELHSSSVISIDYASSEQANYYIVIGYNISNTSFLSFITCYDHLCMDMEEIIIDNSSDINHAFGYSTSLTTYYSNDMGVRYPMFTYSKYSHRFNQYVLNVIICRDFYCNTWIGKSVNESTFNYPPYAVLGMRPNDDTSVAKGVVSIQETSNYATILFCKNMNMSDKVNVFALTVATCTFNSLSPESCEAFQGKELNSTVIFEHQPIKINQVAMMQYEPSAQELDNVPVFMASYIIVDPDHSNITQLWLLYCFNLYCNSINKTFYKVHEGESIDYPQIIIPTTKTIDYHQPTVTFFENATSVMIIVCHNENAPWNCQDHTSIGTIYTISSVAEQESMQISAATNPLVSDQYSILFSMVNSANFNGSTYVNCQDRYCEGSPRVLIDDVMQHASATLFGAEISEPPNTILVICIMSIILCLLCIWKCSSKFKKYLTNVTYPSKLKRILYCILVVMIICYGTCIAPWIIYASPNFDFDQYLRIIILIFPLIPTIISLPMIACAHRAYSSKYSTSYKSWIFVTVLHWLSVILLCCVFWLIWKNETEDEMCNEYKHQISLSSTRFISIIAIITTCVITICLSFWYLSISQPSKVFNSSPKLLNDDSVSPDSPPLLYEKRLSKVLVVLVCIGKYDKNMECKNQANDLKHSDRNQKNMIDLFRSKYNYDIITNKDSRCTVNDYKYLMDIAQKKFSEGDYQCVIMIYSGHGLKRTIVFSDIIYDGVKYEYSQIDRTEMESTFSADAVDNKVDAYKIFFIDSCRGSDHAKIVRNGDHEQKADDNDATTKGTNGDSDEDSEEKTVTKPKHVDERRIVFYPNTANYSSYDLEKLGGLLLGNLHAIMMKNDDGTLNLARICDSIKANVDHRSIPLEDITENSTTIVEYSTTMQITDMQRLYFVKNEDEGSESKWIKNNKAQQLYNIEFI